LNSARKDKDEIEVAPSDFDPAQSDFVTSICGIVSKLELFVNIVENIAKVCITVARATPT
jgi:hypothetical protein